MGFYSQVNGELHSVDLVVLAATFCSRCWIWALCKIAALSPFTLATLQLFFFFGWQFFFLTVIWLNVLIQFIKLFGLMNWKWFHYQKFSFVGAAAICWTVNVDTLGGSSFNQGLETFILTNWMQMQTGYIDFPIDFSFTFPKRTTFGNRRDVRLFPIGPTIINRWW